MKKQYINPITSIFEMHMQNQILAGSGGVRTNASGDVESVGTASGNYSGGTVLSRQNNGLWDDEEE